MSRCEDVSCFYFLCSNPQQFPTAAAGAILEVVGMVKATIGRHFNPSTDLQGHLDEWRYIL